MNIFSLPHSITIQNIESIEADFKLLDMAHPIFTIDTSATEVITTPGIQFLVSLEKTLRQLGGKLTFTGQSTALTQTFENIGLQLNNGELAQ